MHKAFFALVRLISEVTDSQTATSIVRKWTSTWVSDHNVSGRTGDLVANSPLAEFEMSRLKNLLGRAVVDAAAESISETDKLGRVDRLRLYTLNKEPRQ